MNFEEKYTDDRINLTLGIFHDTDAMLPVRQLWCYLLDGKTGFMDAHINKIDEDEWYQFVEAWAGLSHKDLPSYVS